MKPSEVIQKLGLGRLDYQTAAGVCALGAVNIACHGHPEPAAHSNRRCRRLDLALCVTLGEEIIGWSDAWGRTKEQVIALLQEHEVEFTSDVMERPGVVGAIIKPVMELVYRGAE